MASADIVVVDQPCRQLHRAPADFSAALDRRFGPTRSRADGRWGAGADSRALFVTNDGKSLTYWGGWQIWRRIQQRSGGQRLGSHLIRHSYGQNMAHQGAPVSDFHDALGHESDQMARHYAGQARKFAAASLMSKYSLAG